MGEEYEESGNLLTDKREIATSETWESQTDWEAYQSINNVEIENGVISLSTFEPAATPDSAILQYDATTDVFSDGSPATDNDDVDEWRDQIGSNDATGGAPTYNDDELNGEPILDFDGSEDLLFFDERITVEGLAFVATAESGDPYARGILGHSDSADDYLGFDSSSNEFLWRTSESAHFFESPISLSEGVFYIVTVRRDASDVEVFVNGEPSPDNPISASALEPDLIGKRRDNQRYAGRIAEEVVYDSTFTDSDRQEEEQRLSNKWGIDL